MKILDVTPIQNFFNNKELKGGLVKTKLYDDLTWLFYESRYWNPENGGTLMEDAHQCAFLPTRGEHKTRRNGNIVTLVKEKLVEKRANGNHVKISKDYTLIFARQEDARVFTRNGREN